MNYDAVVPALITGVVGILTGYFTLKAQSQKTSSEGIDKFNQNLLSQIDTLTKRLNELESKYKSQSDELLSLKGKNQTLEKLVNEKFNHIAIMYSFYSKIPKPAWMKDRDGYMFFINDAYERQWGVSSLKYDGQTDDYIWPKNIADQFTKNDEVVKLQKKGMCFVEWIPDNLDDPDAAVSEWDVCRFPIVYQDELIGVGGIASKKDLKKTTPQKRRSTDD